MSKPRPPQLPAERPVVAEALHPRGRSHFDELVDVGVVAHDRCGDGFHQIGQARAGKPALERPEERRREDHVADEAQTDQQDRARRLERCRGSRVSVQGSTVASSINITGMSSLIG